MSYRLEALLACIASLAELAVLCNDRLPGAQVQRLPGGAGAVSPVVKIRGTNQGQQQLETLP